jgi:hypothetical protein
MTRRAHPITTSSGQLADFATAYRALGGVFCHCESAKKTFRIDRVR